MSERLSAFDLLEGDHSGAGLRRLQDALFELKMSVKRAVDAGLSSEDFSVAQRVLRAVETAEDAVLRLHDKIVQ